MDFMETVATQMPDGSVLPVRLLAARETHSRRSSPDVTAPVIVIMPGLGVGGRYYTIVAGAIAKRGFDVAVGELRGQGDSEPKPHGKSTFGYHDIAAVDIPAIIQTALARFPGRTPFLLGHSMGGQLSVLYAARNPHLGGIILVGSGTPYYKGRSGVMSPGIIAGSTAMSLTAKVAGYWPGDLVGGFGRQSKILIADWARLARTGRFVPTGADIDYEKHIEKVTAPVLSITLTEDEFSPPAAVEHLAGKLIGAEVTRWTLPSPPGHNAWIRDPEQVADKIAAWIHDR